MTLLNARNKIYTVNHNGFINNIDASVAEKYLTSYIINCEMTNTCFINAILSDKDVKEVFYFKLELGVQLSNMTIKCLFKQLIDKNIDEFYKVFNILADNDTVYKCMCKLEFNQDKYKAAIENAMILRCMTT